jgi:hypothetical protein
MAALLAHEGVISRDTAAKADRKTRVEQQAVLF